MSRRRRAASAATIAAIAVVTGGSAAAGTAAQAAVTGTSRAACGNPATPSSDPTDLVDVDGTAFFIADDGTRGPELWKSDGTKAGTVRLKAIRPSSSAYGYAPRLLTNVGGTLFFSVDDGTHGRELWTSDGTPDGTVLVKDIDPDNEDEYYRYESGPRSLTDVGGTLYFTVDDGTHGRELWTSDGTPGGTVLVKDIDPDNEDEDYGYESGPDQLTEVGGSLFFSVDDGSHGRELWRSDGTAAGTTLVEDIKLDSYDSDPESLTSAGSTLFFTARDGVHGRELWKSDGTEAGTLLVDDIWPGTRASYPYRFAAAGDLVYFSADDGVHGSELWTSDGTETGTVLIKAIDPDDEHPNTGPRQVVGAGDAVFFTIDDGIHGEELWTSDGTDAGTVLTKDIQPGDDPSYAAHLTGLGDTIYFTADDTTHGEELWKSDGTHTGTVMIKDIRPGRGNGMYGYGGPLLASVGESVYFPADDGVRGTELWKTDGTGAGTVLVRDINIGAGFDVQPDGQPDARKGTLKIFVRVYAAGRLALAPVAGSRVKASRHDVARGGTTPLTLVPTKAGMRTLKRTGVLKVKARITFTPCGGAGTSVLRKYTLKLK